MTTLEHNFDAFLLEKIGRKPKNGWSELAKFGYPLDVDGNARKGPTSVAHDVNNEADSSIPLTPATKRGVVGRAPEDARADMFRSLSNHAPKRANHAARTANHAL